MVRLNWCDAFPGRELVTYEPDSRQRLGIWFSSSPESVGPGPGQTDDLLFVSINCCYLIDFYRSASNSNSQQSFTIEPDSSVPRQKKYGLAGLAPLSSCTSQVDDGPWRDPDLELGTGSSQDEGDEEDAAEHTNPKDQEIPEEFHDRPQTKSEMQKLREKFENSMKLVAHLYHDLTLRDEMRMVFTAVTPYMKGYSKALEDQKSKASRRPNKVSKHLSNCAHIYIYMFGIVWVIP